jgi:hypothetical protein
MQGRLPQGAEMVVALGARAGFQPERLAPSITVEVEFPAATRVGFPAVPVARVGRPVQEDNIRQGLVLAAIRPGRNGLPLPSGQFAGSADRPYLLHLRVRVTWRKETDQNRAVVWGRRTASRTR